MHIPDGFFNAATSVAGGAASVGVLSVGVRKAAADLGERQAPLAGLVAAFVFAAQMINFPVAAGTSGHLLGGALAAVLVGPWAATICIAVVLVVQALFADGGLSALGLNILLIAVIPSFVGYGVFAALRPLVRRRTRGIPVAAGLAAFVSVPVAEAAFAVLFAIGGAADISLRTLVGAMVGVHLVIGVGEGVITAATVGAVVAVRPDLVRGGAAAGPALVVRGSVPAAEGS